MPYRAAEAMHWHLGEQEMAARANVPIFQLSNISTSIPAAPQNTSSVSGAAMPPSYSAYPSSAGPSPLASPPGTMPSTTPSHSRRHSYAVSATHRRTNSAKILPNEFSHVLWGQQFGQHTTRPQLKRLHGVTDNDNHAGYMHDYEDCRSFKRLHTPDSGGEEKKLKHERMEQ